MSHALVTHYFGTCAAPVEATLERRFRAMRDELVPVVLGLVESRADVTAISPRAEKPSSALRPNPVNVSPLVWACSSGRAAADDFLPHRMGGL